jgi:cell division protein FtsI/penicillin-binding protein 2
MSDISQEHHQTPRQRPRPRVETPGNKACGGGEAPANDPKVAIAASVECTEQFGNDVAAPIFRDVAEAILNGE